MDNESIKTNLKWAVKKVLKIAIPVLAVLWIFFEIIESQNLAVIAGIFAMWVIATYSLKNKL